MAPKSLSLKNYLLNWWLLFFSLFSFRLVGGRLMSDSAIMKCKRGWKSIFTRLLWVNSSFSRLNFSRMQATFWIIERVYEDQFILCLNPTPTYYYLLLSTLWLNQSRSFSVGLRTEGPSASLWAAAFAQ